MCRNGDESWQQVISPREDESGNSQHYVIQFRDCFQLHPSNTDAADSATLKIQVLDIREMNIEMLTVPS